MDIESSSAKNSRLVAKKLVSILRAVVIMLRRGISKGKLLLELHHHLLLKRGNKLAGKAAGTLLMFNHHQHPPPPYVPSKSSYDAVAASLKEYEFSCSNSPTYPGIFPAALFGKRSAKPFHENNYQIATPGHGRTNSYQLYDDDAATVAAVQRVLEMLNDDSSSTTAAAGIFGSGGSGGGEEHPRVPPSVAPSPNWFLPGFGKSPRRLRITDSPFPVKEENAEERVKVNQAADEFIKKFYRNLKRQTSIGRGRQSP